MTWAGIPPASIPVPGAFTNVLLDAQSDATGVSAITSTEVDYYRFQASSTGPYIISAKTPASNMNPVLGVFSATGQRLRFNDNISGSNRDSQVALNLEAGVTYFVGITNRTTSSRGSYTWKIDGLWGAAPDDAYEQNDSFAAAADLGNLDAETEINGLVLRDGADWFKFNTINVSGDAHSISINFEHRRGDLELALYNSAEEVIGRSRTRNNVETISLKDLATGTYYVQVYSAQGAINPKYALTIDPPTTAAPPSQVDLFGNSIKVTDDVNWDETISIQASIRNTGTTPAGSFNVQWWLSQDNELSADDIVLSRANGVGEKYRVGGVPANGVSSYFGVNLLLPEEAPVGWSQNNALLYVIMDIDVDDEIQNEVRIDGTPGEDNNNGQIGPSKDHAPMALGRKPNGVPVYNIDFNFAGLSATQKTIMKAAAHRWEQIIIGDLPDAAVVNDNNSVQILDDLLLDVISFAGDGEGGNLGSAGPYPFGVDGFGIPRLSFFRIDQADMLALEEDGELYKFAVFAIGRAIGLGTAPAWRQWLVQDTMTLEVFFIGPTARGAYIDVFGADPTTTVGVPVGPFGGFSYWDEGVFGDEILTPGNFAPTDEAPISVVTIGSLADMGYVVNPMAADPYPAMPGPAPAPGAMLGAALPPLSGSLPSGSSSTSNSGTTSSPSAWKSTVPSDSIDFVVHTPNPTAVDALVIEMDFDLYNRIRSGNYDFDYLNLIAPLKV